MEQSLFGYYLLPENAQLRLLQIRDHLRLLTALARPRDISSPNLDELQVSPDALAFCFELLAEQLGDVLEQTRAPYEDGEGKGGIS
ncbi:XAC0095 family protein [Xanthomonas oryzae]|uniref:XAC0095 family protein n=1 Tax=Xanthomonas oryzae TaxID=347 RepID=UPI0004639857|nr:hypothetical protein [Xanthomonas oryzae]AVU00507.1 hypothetical protein C0L89_19720 [Xanthomonas oryzae pv. oryzae]QBN29790.1 hypothetical protein EBA01_19710 [Xanthomonas oryzae pv. oryzae]QBN62535.1 hypothetical protein EBA10_19725 [Xanthomonas oryzae pv. oryzae]QBN66179.1 hypothetical protein EBA11_19680 [Xanthomonas oryzae pv. oryzae]